jgi:cyclase
MHINPILTIMRQKMKKNLFLVFAFFFITSIVPAQMDFNKVQIETVKLSDTVYMLKGAGGNITACIGFDGVLLIDTEYAQLYEKIIDALHKLGGDKIRYVINTHWHGDHTSGNINFAKDAPIIAHKNVRETMMHPKPRMGRTAEPAKPEALPTIVYDTELNIYMNGENVEFFHIPLGHTDGDTGIYFTKSNILVTGDLFFNGSFPYIDLTNGGNVVFYTDGVKFLLDKINDETKIVPGHGNLASKKDFERFFEMLKGTIEYVAEKIVDGKTLDEIQKEDLPEEWSAWGKGFISNKTWIEFIYKSFEGEEN